MNGISALIKKTPSCEVTVRRQLSMNQEVGSHQTLNLLVP